MAGAAQKPAAVMASLSPEDKKKKLEGYVQIPKQFWPYVKYATHIRYIETHDRGGEFRGGGFVLNNPFDVKPKGETVEKRFIKLQNSFNKQAKDHKEWIIAYEDIEYLYAKGTGVELTIREDMFRIAKTLNDLIKDYKKLKSSLSS